LNFTWWCPPGGEGITREIDDSIMGITVAWACPIADFKERV
jgi:hypothetical protein